MTRAERVARGVLVVAGTLALSLLVLSVTWRSVPLGPAGPPDPLSDALSRVYALVLVTASALLFAALRLRPAVRVNVALGVVAAILPLYGFAIALSLNARWVNPRLEVVEDLRRRGARAHVVVGPAVVAAGMLAGNPRTLLPTGGIARTLAVYCREARDWFIYASDEHGFHNPPGLWELPALDVLAVGDSFTHGACVPSDENMVARIRRPYPATLNLGYGGHGPLLMLAALREYLPHLKPAVILWCYFAGNDLDDLHRERDNPILERYLDDDAFSQGLFERQDEIDRELEAYIERASRGRQARLLRDILFLHELRMRALVWTRNLLEESDPGRVVLNEGDYATLRVVLEKVRAMAAEKGSALYFVYLPGPEDVLPEGERGRQAEERRRRVLSTVSDLGLSLVDVLPAFRSAGSEVFACRGCHYGPEGYELAARQALGALARDDRPRR